MKGFTLIEILLYGALFAFILASAMQIVFQLSDSRMRQVERAQAGTEALFVHAKLNWARMNAQTIFVQNGALMIQDSADAAAPLTAERFTVTNFSLQVHGQEVSTSFALNGESFSFIDYAY